MELATALSASAMPFEQTNTRLSEFDVVVCATSAPEAVVSLADAASAIRKRPARPLFFIDLALPRDVEPTVAQLDNVFLYNLDDLATIAEENRAARVTELVKARAIVAEKADLLWKQVEAQVLALAPAPTADLGPALPHPTHQRAD
jgi:glutamyl-tRNA reductase